MKNLTTRKIVLGILMALVLAFSVQGTADAATIDAFSASPVDLSWRNIDETIDFTITVTPTVDGSNESVTFSVSNGATFVDPEDSAKTRSSYVWRETGDTSGDGSQGTFTSPGTVQVTVKRVGIVTATLSATGATSRTMTFYVVKRAFDVNYNDTVSILNVTNGVGGRYSGDIKIHSGDSRHNPVTYTTTGGTLYARFGTTTRRLDLSGTPLKTSSSADVWLDMSADSRTVTAQVEHSDRVTQGTYIHGSPQLAVTEVPDPFEGPPGDEEGNTITVVVNDQLAAGAPGSGGSVAGVPVKFDVADKSPMGGYLIRPDTTTYTIVDVSNNPIMLANIPPAAKTFYVRTIAGGAQVGFQFGTIPGEADVVVSVSGRNVNISETVKAKVTGDATTQLSIASNTRRSGNSKIFDLVALVERDGEALRGVTVTFQTRFGNLGNTPTGSTGITRPSPESGTVNDDQAQQTGLQVTDITNHLGKAQVSYNLGDNTGRQEIDASIYDANADLRQEITFVVNGPAGSGPQPQPQPQPGAGTPTVSPLTLTGAPNSPHSITVTAPAGTTVRIGTNTFSEAGGSAVPAIGSGTTTSVITLPSTVGTYTLPIDAGGTPLSVSITVTTAPAGGTTTGTLSLDVPVSGASGQPLLVTVTATTADNNPGANVAITLSTNGGIGSLSSQTVRTNNSGVATATLTLGTAGSTGFVIARAPGYSEDQLRVSVSGEAPPIPPRTPTPGVHLLVADGDNQTGEPSRRLAEPLVVRVVNSAGQAVPNQVVQFTVIRGGGRVSPLNATTDASGQAQTWLTLGRSAGTNTVRATLDGVSVTFTATAETAPTLLEVYDGDNQRGVLNTELADPLVVLVTDDNGNGVADVNVRFQVTSRNARLTQRGTGYALRVDTDQNGMAEVPLTPTGAGTITVQVTASGLDAVEFTITTGPPPASLTKRSGDNQAGNPDSALANPLVVEVEDAEGNAVDGITVTFEVTDGGGSLSETTATTNAQGRAQTSLTLGSERAVNSVRASVAGLDPVTFNTSLEAVVHIAAANRPVMYWIDGGALYRLADARAQRIAASANDVAVDTAGGKIYWTEETGNAAGKIHSANLDGSGAQVIKELTSLPYGLAVDSANGKLYLTNSRSKIRQMNVDGSQFKPNFIQGLDDPLNVAVASGNIYWTEAGGSVRVANLEGTKVVRNIVTGTGTLGGIAVGGNKVYWTEQTGEAAGRIRSANLNGRGVSNVITLDAVPRGIAVDVADGKLFWTDDQGRIQRIRIDNQKRVNAVSGLMAPSALALGVENAADAAPTQTETPRTPTTAKSKYDVNGDGTVDTTDVGVVVAAVLSGNQQASLDVNGDGKVDLSDVVAVSQNVDNSGAAAPALRTRLSSVQVDRIQEQIDLLLAMNDRSPGALYALAYLQNLLAMARPEKTQLLANYPNPFNPETWIPYELATDTNVKLTIYNAHGVVVRTLKLGHQTAGYYTGRDRAAYWDGRNSFGELVASGLYFYQLETDKTSSMRKMVILK